jgi:hypothetical protein
MHSESFQCSGPGGRDFPQKKRESSFFTLTTNSSVSDGVKKGVSDYDYYYAIGIDGAHREFGDALQQFTTVPTIFTGFWRLVDRTEILRAQETRRVHFQLVFICSCPESTYPELRGKTVTIVSHLNGMIF